MGDIASAINELKELENESIRIKKQLKDLNGRKKKLEDQIKKYLEAKDQIGLKYRDVAVIAQPSTKRTRVKKQEQVERVQTYLENAGMRVKPDIVEKILEQLKGEEKETVKIKLTNINKLK
jgi:hypothetical protein